MKSRKTKKSFLAKHDPNRQNGRCLLSLLKNTVGTILWALQSVVSDITAEVERKKLCSNMSLRGTY